jgi:acetyl esterase/lipase
MKILYAFALAICSSIVFAQGPQIPVSFSVYQGWDPIAKEGWLYLPADYNTSTKKYPVLLYNHGSGIYTKESLLTQGLPQLIAGGMRPDNIINPADGKAYSFIVLSIVQADNRSVPSQIRWLEKNYRIDLSRVYITGLSQGGAMSMYAIAQKGQDSVASKLAAAVPMSAPPEFTAGTYDYNLINKYKIHTWHLSGSSDSFTENGAKKDNRMANSVFPGSSFLTIFNAGHCCWNTYYNVSYKDPELQMNIYQWMLQYRRTELVPAVKFKSITLKKKS